jgi:hypothetical protein
MSVGSMVVIRFFGVSAFRRFGSGVRPPCRSAIALLERPCHQRKHLELSLGQVLERRVAFPALADELRDNRRVEHGGTLAGPADACR